MDPKKISLESLTKEELIQRYKNLLTIAQKAKAAKDGEILNQILSLESSDDCEAQVEVTKLKAEVEQDKEKLAVAEADNEKLGGANTEKEEQLESLRLQLCRAEADCSVLESQLETLDTENRRLSQVANNAELQLRLGAEIRQDALEGMGEELANVKNTAVEALAERDSLRARLREQNTTNSDSETLESCQAKIQVLRASQSQLRTDIVSMQTAARSMASELVQALTKAQEATEDAARLRSKDILAEMNEAMKTRGEVAAQLAEKLGVVERERDAAREEKSKVQEAVKKLEETVELLEKDKKAISLELKNATIQIVELQSSESKLKEEMTSLQSELNLSRQLSSDLEEKLNVKSEEIKDVNEEFVKLQINFEEFKANNYENTKEIEKLEDKCRQLIEINKEKDSLLDGIQLKIADSEVESPAENNFSAEFEEAKNEVVSLKTKLASEQEKNVQLDENNNLLTEKIKVLENFKCMTEKSLSLIEKEKVELVKKVEDQEQQWQVLAKEKLDLENKLKYESSSLQNLKESNAALAQKLKNFEEESVAATEMKTQNKDLQEQLVILREKISEMEKEECEVGSVSTVSKVDEAARLRDVEESFEDRYIKLKAVAIKMKQKCQEQAGMLTKLAAEKVEMQNKVTAAMKDKDNLARNLQSMQAACDKSADDAEAARDKLKSNEKQLTRAGEELAKSRSQYVESTDKVAAVEAKLKQTKEELESARAEIKKNSVLNLEMAAYEKSATEQDRKLKDVSKELETLKAQLECQKKLAHEGKTNATDWEEKFSTLKAAKEKLAEDLAQRKSNAQELESKLAEKVQKLAESEANFEAQRSQLERLEVQLSQISADKLRLEEDTSRLKEQVSRQIRILEEEVTTAKVTLKERDVEMAKIQSEFEGYKVRAQAVLLKAQQQHPPKEEKDPEKECELALMKTTVERLQTALCDASCKEKALQVEISAISGQFAESQSTTRRLIDQISELNTRNEELSVNLKKGEENLRDLNRKHKLAVDTLASSYKQQLIEAEARHKAQVAALIEEKKEQAASLEESAPVTLLKREEGEGSENVDSVKGNASSNSRDPIPLDRLLSISSDYQDDAKSEISYDAPSMSSTLASERRAKHLAALLGEAEADLARLTHQNAILKEEIRRQQRCAERLQHTEKNGEYLKNVVLKFVTLQGGDERARLVPVLNTILKFSPDELQQLNAVAVPTTPTSPTSPQGGWGSYLHLWSGTH